MGKYRYNIIYFLLAVIISVIVFISAIDLVSLDFRNYGKKYRIYDIEKRLPLNEAESVELMEDTVDYILVGKDSARLRDYYKFYEMIHLKDVRNIFILIHRLRNILLLVLVITLLTMGRRAGFMEKLKLISKYMFINYILGLIIALLALINFRGIFLAFHKILFRNDFWLLDPEIDILIQLLPEDMFRHGLVKLIILHFILIIIIKIIIYLWGRKLNSRV